MQPNEPCRFQRHSFVIPAHGYSPHLQECVASLQGQYERSDLILSTSTPSAYLEHIAFSHGLRLAVNPVSGGIAADWNFALRQARTPYVTLAHQDDVYDPSYARMICDRLDAHPGAALAFSDYGELRGAAREARNLNLVTKRLLLLPLRLSGHTARNRFLKRLILSCGSPIPCPAVTYNRRMLESFAFSGDFTVNLDWDAWLRLADRPGEFVRVPLVLMWHRIHSRSATSQGLHTRAREEEDRRMFARLLPPPLALAAGLLYRLSYKSNTSNMRRVKP